LDQLPLIVVLVVICLGICFASEFTSNTATTQLVLPILVALAAQMKVNPLMILLPATIACSWGFMLPVGTPPNAIVFGTSRVRMIEMASVGIVVNLIAVAVVILAIFAWGRSIWGIESLASPPWAE
jgi:sodium-dependent dicarboxylate transporter 2/3/5